MENDINELKNQNNEKLIPELVFEYNSEGIYYFKKR